MKVTAENIRKFEKNTLMGFFDIDMEGLLRINGCTVHCKNGSWWIGLPAKAYEDKDKNTKWQPIIEFRKDRLENLKNLLIPQLRAELEAGPLPEKAKPVSCDYPKGEKKPNPRQQALDEARDWVVPDDTLDDDIPF